MNNFFSSLIRITPNFSLVVQPSLALTVFRYVPQPKADQPALTLESLNDLNRLLHGRISARHDIMMTQTTLNGIFCIRFVTGATRTTEAHVRAAYDIVCKEAETALEIWDQTSKATVSLLAGGKLYLEDINTFVDSFCTNFHKVCELSYIRAALRNNKMNSGVL